MMASEQGDESKVEGEGGRRSSPDQMRREIEEEFNVQRAKMKDLFLQKEDELHKLSQEKEQLSSEVASLRAELEQLQTLSHNQTSEIQSLQLLVNETVEASSSGSEEARRLRARNNELEQLLAHARQQLQHQEASLAPATLVRNIARKLGADDSDQPSRRPLVNTEDSELFRSVVDPLEQEITALKNKLRETDTQLQEALKGKTAAAVAGGDSRSDPEGVAAGGAAGGTASGAAGGALACDMCANYEAQLVAAQRLADANKEQAHRMQHALRLATEELEGARSLHDETVVSWRAQRAAAAAALAGLRTATEEAGSAAAAAAARCDAAAARAVNAVTDLTVDRETLQRKLDTLERDNAMLIGQYTKKAMDMQNEVIDLPNNVEELQELSLRLREQLICCEIGREAALAAESDLRTQLLAQAAELTANETAQHALREELKETREKLEHLQTEHSHMRELGDKLRQAGDMVEGLLEDKKRLQTEKQELRAQISSLQHELDTSEKVQQDFVRLSQSLQMEMQHLRSADTEVRWQHADDVGACGACHAALSSARSKQHCRHCGRIYCAACLTPVPSGARGRTAPVCPPCATLLRAHAAPYFATRAPDPP